MTIANKDTFKKKKKRDVVEFDTDGMTYLLVKPNLYELSLFNDIAESYLIKLHGIDYSKTSSGSLLKAGLTLAFFLSDSNCNRLFEFKYDKKTLELDQQFVDDAESVVSNLDVKELKSLSDFIGNLVSDAYDLSVNKDLIAAKKN